MSNPQKLHDTLLKEHGFRLIRNSRHLVYQDREGRTYVVSSTPSDFRAARKALSVLKRVIASPPVPEVIAISEFGRLEAVERLAARAKGSGSGHSKQKSSGGCGISYIEPTKTILVQSPEKRQYEKDLRQWETEVWAAQKRFVEGVLQKLKPLLAKTQEEDSRMRQVLTDRYRWYANTRLKNDVARMSHFEKDKNTPEGAFIAISPLLNDVIYINSGDIPSLQTGDFADRVIACKACVAVDDDNTTLCDDHYYERCRAACLDIDTFLKPIGTLATVDTIAKWAKKSFQDAMRNDGEFWKNVDEEGSISRRKLGHVLYRHAFRKLRPIIEELHRGRPVKPEREVVEVVA